MHTYRSCASKFLLNRTNGKLELECPACQCTWSKVDAAPIMTVAWVMNQYREYETVLLQKLAKQRISNDPATQQALAKINQAIEKLQDMLKAAKVRHCAAYQSRTGLFACV
jgi:hypothetical protein